MILRRRKNIKGGKSGLRNFNIDDLAAEERLYSSHIKEKEKGRENGNERKKERKKEKKYYLEM